MSDCHGQEVDGEGLTGDSRVGGSARTSVRLGGGEGRVRQHDLDKARVGEPERRTVTSRPVQSRELWAGLVLGGSWVLAENSEKLGV